MPRTSIDLARLQELIRQQLHGRPAVERQFFDHASLTPSKWSLVPWGNETGGFWVVAIFEDRALWYNDIANGFSVSRFVARGAIPTDEYRSGPDPLPSALRALVGAHGFGSISRGPRAVTAAPGEEERTFRREIAAILGSKPEELDLARDLWRSGLDELDVYECIQVAEDIWNAALVPNPCPNYLFSELVRRYTTPASIMEMARSSPNA